MIIVAAIAAPLAVLEAQKKTVVMMGDSLTVESYWAAADYLGQGYTVQPAAIGGSGLLDTQVDWVARAHQVIDDSNPSVVVAEFIGDYGLLGERPGVAAHSVAWYEQWAQVAQQMEDVLTSRGATVYWVIGPPVQDPANNQAIVELDKIYANLHVPNTASGHPPLINVTPLLTGGTGTYTQDVPGPGGTPVEVRTPDGTHFTLYGIALFGKAVAEGILS
ncbi:MAG: hypothetical protein ACRDV6_03390 [Acidimicrobiales bacterium]